MYCASPTIAKEASIACTSETAISVTTGGIRTAIVGSTHALVDIYTFASGAFFVSSVTCTEIGSALFCTGCVGSTDVRVISTFQYVLCAVDALPSSVTDTGASTFVTCPSVAEVTFALTGTVQAIGCTGALNTLSSSKRISSNAITRVGPWRVGTVRVEGTYGGVQTLVDVICTSGSFPASLTSTTAIHVVTRLSVLCIAATIRFAVEAVFTRVTVNASPLIHIQFLSCHTATCISETWSILGAVLTAWIRGTFVDVITSISICIQLVASVTEAVFRSISSDSALLGTVEGSIGAYSLSITSSPCCGV